MTDIYLGFAESRLYNEDGVLFYDMWPAVGTQMTLPLRGAVSKLTVIRNTDDELVLSRGIFRYKFRFSSRKAGPDALKYSVRIFGVLPIGTHWGEISSESKRELRAVFSGQHD